MALGRPVIDVGHLPRGDAPGGVNFIIERPAADGLPEVIRIVDSDEDISSDEEEIGVAQVGIFIAGDEEEEFVEDLLDSDEEEDEDLDDLEEEDDFQDDWFDEVSGDSGYETMTDDDDDPEGDDEDDGLVFWRGWRRPDAPFPAPHPPVPRPVPIPAPVPAPPPPPVPDPVPVPQQPTAMHPQEPPGQRLDPPVPSTSGTGSSSKKRSMEEDDTGQEGLVHWTRWTSEDSQEEPTPSTSGLGPSTSRSSGDSYRDSAPSTSGLGSSTNRRFWMDGVQFQMWSDDSDSD